MNDILKNDDKSDDCLFCKIVSGEIPSEAVYQDEFVYAFKDIAPKAPFHILIVPKNHYSDVAELAQKDATILSHLVKKSQEIANGDYNLVFNSGANAGQTVFHIHGHILKGANIGL